MSRYTGPRLRVMRALGVQLPGLSAKAYDRRPQPPGEHGAGRRDKLSEYGKRLREKQKLRMNYGLTEKQLRRLFSKALRSKEATGAKLIELVERRLDNVVFRAGFARSIPAARQLVNHGHLTVNGQRVDIASWTVRRGDVVGFRDSSRDLAAVAEALAEPTLSTPVWLQVEPQERRAKLTDLPGPLDLPFPLDVQLIVEFYARG